MRIMEQCNYAFLYQDIFETIREYVGIGIIDLRCNFVNVIMVITRVNFQTIALH